jgi:D-apiose dehydrogenase
MIQLTSQMNVGVNGCGFFAQDHLHSWNDLRPAGSICDIDPGKAKTAAEKFG